MRIIAEFIDIQKRIKRRKRRFKFFLTLFLISILVVFLFKTPVFKVKSITVYGNSIISDERVVELSKIKQGDNLLKLNIKEINKNILTNSYIETSRIKRTIFGQVYINVGERTCAGISYFGDKYVTIDKKGVIIEILDSVDDINLPLVSGLEIMSAVPGKVMELSDPRKLNAFNIIIDSISNSGLSDIISEIDVNNLLSITIGTVYDIEIKIGTIDDTDNKLKISKAIIEEDILEKGLTGTIDVSFKGNPVFRRDEVLVE